MLPLKSLAGAQMIVHGLKSLPSPFANPLKEPKLHDGQTTRENHKPMHLQTRAWVTL